MIVERKEGARGRRNRTCGRIEEHQHICVGRPQEELRAWACGACTVPMGGKGVKSCLSLAALVEGREITITEGLPKSIEVAVEPIK